MADIITSALVKSFMETTTTAQMRTVIGALAPNGDGSALTGVIAASAAVLTTPRTIGGSSFDGSANVTSFPVPGAIGGTTPAAGAFTTLSGTTGTLTGNLTFGTSASILNGATGAIGLTATGTNQAITLTPSGTGDVVVSSGAALLVGATADQIAGGSNIQVTGVSGTLLNLRATGTTSGAINTGAQAVFTGHNGSAAVNGGILGVFKENGSGGNSAYYLNFSVNSGAGVTEAARFASTGNLLLGGLTTDGTGKLQFPAATTNAGGINFGTEIFFFRTGTNTAQLSASAGLSLTGLLAVAGATASSSTALIVPASTTAISSLRVPHGAAPTAPVNGDLWTTTAGIFGRINGSTVGPLAAGGSGTVSSGTTNTLAKYTAATTVGDSLITDDGTTMTYSGTGGIASSGSATGVITATGATSGALKLTGVDAMAQIVTINLAAQTSGAATITILDQAGVSRNMLTAGTLTATRVPFVSANGVLTDDADMTFVTDTLTATKFAGAFNGTLGVTTPAAATVTTLVVNTSALPDANDGAPLGAAGTGWSDLFLAEGAVINWDSSDCTLTQTNNTLTVAGAEFIIDAASGPTSTVAGGFRGIPQNSQSTAYTTVLADAGKHILHPTADNNARTFTIDSNANVAYPIGTAITFINQINTVTIAITTDTMTLLPAGTTGSRTLAANNQATAVKVAATAWVITGTSGLT